MMIEERLANLEPRMARAKRRNRSLMAVIMLVAAGAVVAAALVWPSTQANAQTAVTTCLTASTAAENVGATVALQEQVRRLTAEIEMHKATVRRLSEENKRLAAENQTLKNQLGRPQKLGPSAATPQPAKGETYTYLGKPRPGTWFDSMYQKFKDKIALVDGRYIDVGASQFEKNEVGAMPPKAGTELRVMPVPSKVFQILGKDELLIHRPGYRPKPVGTRFGLGEYHDEVQKSILQGPDILFRVKGLDTSRLAEGKSLPPVSAKIALIFTGNYTYRSAIGASKTVQSYAVYRPLTREQFAGALDQDFRLVEYRLAPIDPKKRKPDWVVVSKSIKRVGKKEPEQKYYRVLAQPVP